MGLLDTKLHGSKLLEIGTLPQEALHDATYADCALCREVHRPRESRKPYHFQDVPAAALYGFLQLWRLLAGVWLLAGLVQLPLFEGHLCHIGDATAHKHHAVTSHSATVGSRRHTVHLQTLSSASPLAEVEVCHQLIIGVAPLHARVFLMILWLQNPVVTCDTQRRGASTNWC